MARYKNLGNAISIPIKDEYEIIAFITLANKEKSEFKCDLSLRDVEAGMIIELDKSPTLISAYKTVRADVLNNIQKLIDNGYFDKDVATMSNLYDCMTQLRNLIHKED